MGEFRDVACKNHGDFMCDPHYRQLVTEIKQRWGEGQGGWKEVAVKETRVRLGVSRALHQQGP